MGERAVGVAAADGPVSSAIGHRLGSRAVPVDRRMLPPDLSVVVVVGGEPDPTLVRLAREIGVPLLPVWTENGCAYLGPLVVTGVAGCPTCVRMRRDKALTSEWRAARERFPDGFVAPDAHLSGFALNALADLVVDEIDGVAGSVGAGGRTARAMVRLRLDDLAVSRHRLVPEPFCPDCGEVLDDGPDTARISMTSRPKPDSNGSRTRDLRSVAAELNAAYVDEELGLIRGLQRSIDGVCPTVAAPMGLRVGIDQTETGFGRELSFELAALTSIAEGIERYGGVRPGGKRTACTDTYRRLGERAVDPRSFGLHDDEQYLQPGFPYDRFDDDRTMNWVWAWSFARAEPVLVPETLAYYRMAEHAAATRPIAFEISNGCALGSSLEEAILHGMLEVVERDAFLMTWYAQIPQRRLDLDRVRNRRIALMVERLQHRTGYEVMAFDTTAEHGVPSAWAMVVDPMHRDDAPKALCAAGAALDPERAIMSALLELAPLLEWNIGTYPGDRDAAAAMVADPRAVRTMHDHSLVNSHPAAFGRFDFLLAGADELHSPGESFASALQPRNSDLTEDLRAVIDRFLVRGMDVLVVDQTTPEHRICGFSCVKVLIPGMLPMTFGHWARRTNGLPRLGTVAQELGHRSSPLPLSDLNPHPHPFP